MKVTKKGQVTIPAHIRELLGIQPETEVDFGVENNRVYLVKQTAGRKSKRFRRYRGVAIVRMTTEEIMALTRGQK